METIIFATKNKGKIKEINAILADVPDVEVVSMEEAGITVDVVEDGTTFESNAMKKAIEIMEASGKITLSDDSGLEIDAMDKAPGVYSARFMGEDTPYPERFVAIFEKLKDVPKEGRTARFVSCIGCAFPDGRRFSTYDTVEGYIGYEAKGENGFGYDPIFVSDELGECLAVVSPEEKNRISHRGKALRKMKEILKEELIK
ncbi:RdgB/HAM1 family non-canonical purine NTP pyrophosphatase [Chakrabartyella piscis]|uniref:RdgB/HAM1 family non-canonical purine NTP pyrophosphatase n=1 Tax=Chakrabartyella piscis TaxID=2918914 RepID=UPI00295861A7|nr:RdgB/HAM1 family non-canonical purine NTP pyrophosphatase [Chakrabartyella piscis]